MPCEDPFCLGDNLCVDFCTVMSLLTVERSCSCECLSKCGCESDSSLEEDIEVDGNANEEVFYARSRTSSFEGFFASKGAAYAIPDGDFARKATEKGGELHLHLQEMVNLIRDEDTMRLIVKVESLSKYTRYLSIITTYGVTDEEESILVGFDWVDENVTIGLVIPLWNNVSIDLDGDGGFKIITNHQQYIFKPVSVQTMWTALQWIHRCLAKARKGKHFSGGMSHAWLGYYQNRILSPMECIAFWEYTDDLVMKREEPSFEKVKTDEELLRGLIRHKLKEILKRYDLDEVTCRQVRDVLEDEMKMSLRHLKGYIDEQMLIVVGRMDSASKITDSIYLGSEWNASNLEELKENGIGYILNVTKEIDNFFPGTFEYMNVRLHDVEEADLLRHWGKTYHFLHKAKERGSTAFVHCRRGISRSASTVVAFLMKEHKMSLHDAMKLVKSKRSIVQPNPGFWKQLITYEGILRSSEHRYSSLFRRRANSESNLRRSHKKLRRKISIERSAETDETDAHRHAQTLPRMHEPSASLRTELQTGTLANDIDGNEILSLSHAEISGSSTSSDDDSASDSDDEQFGASMRRTKSEPAMKTMEQALPIERKPRARTFVERNTGNDDDILSPVMSPTKVPANFDDQSNAMLSVDIEQNEGLGEDVRSVETSGSLACDTPLVLEKSAIPEDKDDVAQMTSDGSRMMSDDAGMTSDNTEMTSGNPVMMSDNTEMTSSSTQMTSGNNEITPSGTEMTLGYTEMTSESIEMTSGNTEVASGNTQMTSGNTQMTSDCTKMTSDRSSEEKHEDQTGLAVEESTTEEVTTTPLEREKSANDDDREMSEGVSEVSKVMTENRADGDAGQVVRPRRRSIGNKLEEKMIAKQGKCEHSEILKKIHEGRGRVRRRERKSKSDLQLSESGFVKRHTQVIEEHMLYSLLKDSENTLASLATEVLMDLAPPLVAPKKEYTSQEDVVENSEKIDEGDSEKDSVEKKSANILEKYSEDISGTSSVENSENIPENISGTNSGANSGANSEENAGRDAEKKSGNIFEEDSGKKFKNFEKKSLESYEEIDGNVSEKNLEKNVGNPSESYSENSERNAGGNSGKCSMKTSKKNSENRSGRYAEEDLENVSKADSGENSEKNAASDSQKSSMENDEKASRNITESITENNSDENSEKNSGASFVKNSENVSEKASVDISETNVPIEKAEPSDAVVQENEKNVFLGNEDVNHILKAINAEAREEIKQKLEVSRVAPVVRNDVMRDDVTQDDDICIDAMTWIDMTSHHGNVVKRKSAAFENLSAERSKTTDSKSKGLGVRSNVSDPGPGKNPDASDVAGVSIPDVPIEQDAVRSTGAEFGVKVPKLDLVEQSNEKMVDTSCTIIVEDYNQWETSSVRERTRILENIIANTGGSFPSPRARKEGRRITKETHVTDEELDAEVTRLFCDVNVVSQDDSMLRIREDRGRSEGRPTSCPVGQQDESAEERVRLLVGKFENSKDT